MCVNTRIKDIIATVIPDEHHWKITLLEKWPLLLGPLHEHIKIEVIKEHVLIVSASHPAWGQELTYLIPILKDQINKLLGHIYIDKIRVIVKKKKSKKIKPQQASPPKKLAKRALTLKEKTKLATISNKELRTALSQLLSICPPLSEESRRCTNQKK